MACKRKHPGQTSSDDTTTSSYVDCSPFSTTVSVADETRAPLRQRIGAPPPLHQHAAPPLPFPVLEHECRQTRPFALPAGWAATGSGNFAALCGGGGGASVGGGGGGMKRCSSAPELAQLLLQQQQHQQQQQNQQQQHQQQPLPLAHQGSSGPLQHLAWL